MLIIFQVIVSIFLIVLILLQQRGGGLGALGGAGGAGMPYQKRRGVEKMMFWATILAAALFAVLAVLNLAY